MKLEDWQPKSNSIEGDIFLCRMTKNWDKEESVDLNKLFWDGFREGKKIAQRGIYCSALPCHKHPRYINGFVEGQNTGIHNFNEKHFLIKYIIKFLNSLNN